jgi:hypothetical protein
MSQIMIQKYADFIPVSLNSKDSLDVQVARLVDLHGADNVYVDGVSAASTQAPAAIESAPASTQPKPKRRKKGASV